MQHRFIASFTAAAWQLREMRGLLKVPTAQGSATSSLADKVLSRNFVFEANDQKLESLALTSSTAGTLTVTLRAAGNESRIPCGHREWKKGRAPVMGSRLAQLPDEPIAGSFAWQADDTCVIKLCVYETPFHMILTLKFDDDNSRWTQKPMWPSGRTSDRN